MDEQVTLTNVLAVLVGLVIAAAFSFFRERIGAALKRLPGIFRERDRLRRQVSTLTDELEGVRLRNRTLAEKAQTAVKDGEALLTELDRIETGMNELCVAMNAERGSIYVPLVDHNRQPLGLVYLSLYPFDLASERLKGNVIPLVGSHAGEAFRTGQPLFKPRAGSDPRHYRAADQQSGFRTGDMLTVPVTAQGETLAVVQVLNRRNEQGFTFDDQQALMLAGERLFADLTALLSDPRKVRALGVYKVPLEQVTVLACDLSGSSELYSGGLGLSGAVQTVNRYLETVCGAALPFGATIDNYVGDGVVMRFNQPLAIADHPARATEAALAMVDAFEDLKRQPVGNPLADKWMRCGVASGVGLIGPVGDAHSNTWRIMGLPVSAAAVLCQIAPRDRNTIYIDDRTAKALDPARLGIGLDEIAPDRLGKASQLLVQAYEISRSG